ncbi:MAG: hypothetical protein CM15mP87_02760 [Candidatus Neomarinimicrobiota bacterium]|nr:MAG: hypothetical protein CM15mP87_02760 [Candidatus Neomarinimicrobiota bacterium]
MKIKLSDIKSGFKDKFFDIPTNSIPNRGTSFKHNSIHCTLSSLTFQSNRYGLKGYIDATIGHECVRCLDVFESKISLPLEICLESNNIEESLESESENVIKFSNSMDEIDIGVFLADFIELEKPMNPLCNNDCLGLCVVCGINKSETPVIAKLIRDMKFGTN